MGAMLPNLFSLNFLVPKVAMAIEIGNAVRGLRGMPRNVLLIGQKLPAGTLTDNTVMQVTTEANAIALLGEGSQLLGMWRAAKLNAEPGLPILVVAAPEATGSSASAGKLSLTITGDSADYAGTLSLYIGGELVRVGIALGDSPSALASRVVAAINAETYLPVTAAVNGTNNFEVDLTCRWKGDTGNDIDLRVGYYADEVLPQGVTATVTAMDGGATNPDLSDVIAAMAGQRFTEIASAFTDSANLTLLEEELERRWAFDSMQDGQLVTVVRGTEGQLTTFSDGRNSPAGHTVGVTNDLSNPWETAAMLGASIESSSATDPAVPYSGRELKGYRPAPAQERFLGDQNNVLLTHGISTLDGEYMERMVTNYTENKLGAPDISLRNLNWVKTLSYWRWFRVSTVHLKYLSKGYKLGEYVTEPKPGQKIMTKELAEEIALEDYQTFMDAGLMQSMEHYHSKLITEIDGAHGKVKQVESPLLMTQFYQMEVTSEFAVN